MSCGNSTPTTITVASKILGAHHYQLQWFHRAILIDKHYATVQYLTFEPYRTNSSESLLVPQTNVASPNNSAVLTNSSL